jgi:hypothetical protein
MGTRKDIKTYRQFGQTRPKGFDNPGLGVNQRTMVNRILKEICIYSMCVCVCVALICSTVSGFCEHGNEILIFGWPCIIV